MKEECNEDISPCVGVCQYNDEDLCSGCFRTSEEISKWFDIYHEVLINDAHQLKIHLELVL